MNNLKSYDGVESVQYDFNETDLLAYFNNKMESAKSNCDFILQNVFHENPLEICEIGSVNSKLLYSLENAGILKGACGYEVSESRFIMAEKFKELAGSKCVKNINSDILKETIERGRFDLVIGVDIVLQIISPLYDNAESDLLGK